MEHIYTIALIASHLVVLGIGFWVGHSGFSTVASDIETDLEDIKTLIVGTKTVATTPVVTAPVVVATPVA